MILGKEDKNNGLEIEDFEYHRKDPKNYFFYIYIYA